jgi:hypothetical protein
MDKKEKDVTRTVSTPNADEHETLSGALAKIPPELAEVIKRTKTTLDARTEALTIAGKIHQEVEKEIGEPVQTWLPMCPMPTDLCRVSPFFPMARQHLGKRDFVEDLIITKSSWGEIKYYGPRLSTHEEDVIMALLALLDQAKYRTEENVDGDTTYSYRGPILPLLELMGCKKPGRREYRRFLNALKLLVVAGMELTIYKPAGKGKSKRNRWQVTNILSTGYWDEEKQEVVISVNPYFFHTYNQGAITLIDVMERSTLKSPVAKCLHRFMRSHQAERWKGHFLTLATTLNLDLDQPNKEVKRYIKRAIDELRQVGFLAKGSGFPKATPDVVVLVRGSQASKRKKISITKNVRTT